MRRWTSGYHTRTKQATFCVDQLLLALKNDIATCSFITWRIFYLLCFDTECLHKATSPLKCSTVVLTPILEKDASQVTCCYYYGWDRHRVLKWVMKNLKEQYAVTSSLCWSYVFVTKAHSSSVKSQPRTLIIRGEIYKFMQLRSLLFEVTSELCAMARKLMSVVAELMGH